jgi:hypothetical protein
MTNTDTRLTTIESGAVANYSQTEYTTTQRGMLMPLASAEEAQLAISAYEELKTAIVRPDDLQVIQGRPFLKKSFWRRVAACFGLSLELVHEERLLLDGKLAYRATYRAIAPNGRSMDGDGMCMQGEKGSMIEHNIRAIAHTRAKNRAISDLVGGGEVSADEMPDEDEPQSRTTRPAAQAQSTHAPDRVGAALRNADILKLLNRLDCRDTTSQRAKLEEAFTALETVRATLNPANLKAELQRQIDLADAQTVEADAATGHDLASLGTGHGA